MSKYIKSILLAYIVLVLNGCAGFLADLGLDNPEKQQATSSCTDDDCDDEDFNAGYVADANFHDGWKSAREEKIREAIDSNDVVLGMSKSQVVQSWGDPVMREIAGSGNTALERWKYGSRNSMGGERFLIFENGYVTSWHR